LITLFPYTTLFRSRSICCSAPPGAAQGVAIANDKCVRDLRISREWVREDFQMEGIHVYVRPLPDDPPPKRARKRKTRAEVER